MSRITNLKDLKIGEKLFAIPTGNNARYKNDEIVCFTIVSIGRKYVKLSKEGSGYTKSYCIKTGSTQEAINAGFSLNAGYIFFASAQDLLLHKKNEKIKSKVEKFFRGLYALSKLNNSEINDIYKIIKGKCDE